MKEILEAKIKELTEQRAILVANTNAVDGAIQVCQQLMSQNADLDLTTKLTPPAA